MQYRQVVGLLAVSASLASCTLLKTSCREDGISRIAERDSSAVIYNDSIDAVILCADKVRLYDMADFVGKDSAAKEMRDSLFSYAVNKDIGLLKKKNMEVLRFIVSDKSWYIKDYAPIRQPFHPNIAFEFTHKRSKAYIFVSFGTEEVAIAAADGKFKFFLMRDKRQMARWAAMMFPEKDYYRILLNV